MSPSELTASPLGCHRSGTHWKERCDLPPRTGTSLWMDLLSCTGMFPCLISSCALSLVGKGERGTAEFAGKHLLSARNEGRRRLHRRPRGQVTKFPTGAAEERQENPWSRGHPPEAKSSHCGRT